MGTVYTVTVSSCLLKRGRLTVTERKFRNNVIGIRQENLHSVSSRWANVVKT